MLTESKDTFEVWLKLFEQLLLVGLILAFVFLLVMSIKFQDTKFLRKSPALFILELLAFSAIPAIPLWIFMITRGVSFKVTLVWFGALWAKFAVLHALFEFSGVYGHYFEPKK
jgi:ribose/xylose/arabinose/galactoside ABC-type transport system permease subunit